MSDDEETKKWKKEMAALIEHRRNDPKAQRAMPFPVTYLDQDALRHSNQAVGRMTDMGMAKSAKVPAKEMMVAIKAIRKDNQDVVNDCPHEEGQTVKQLEMQMRPG